MEKTKTNFITSTLPPQATAYTNGSSTNTIMLSFRLQVHLPYGQLYVMRVSKDMKIQDVLDSVKDAKNINIEKFHVLNTHNLEQILDYQKSLGDYGIKELTLEQENVSSAHIESSVHVIKRVKNNKSSSISEQVKNFFNKMTKAPSYAKEKNLRPMTMPYNKQTAQLTLQNNTAGTSAAPSSAPARSSLPPMAEFKKPQAPPRKRVPAPAPPARKNPVARTASSSAAGRPEINVMTTIPTSNGVAFGANTNVANTTTVAPATRNDAAIATSGVVAGSDWHCTPSESSGEAESIDGVMSECSDVGRRGSDLGMPRHHKLEKCFASSADLRSVHPPLPAMRRGGSEQALNKPVQRQKRPAPRPPSFNAKQLIEEQTVEENGYLTNGETNYRSERKVSEITIREAEGCEPNEESRTGNIMEVPSLRISKIDVIDSHAQRQQITLQDLPEATITKVVDCRPNEQSKTEKIQQETNSNTANVCIIETRLQTQAQNVEKVSNAKIKIDVVPNGKLQTEKLDKSSETKILDVDVEKETENGNNVVVIQKPKIEVCILNDKIKNESFTDLSKVQNSEVDICESNEQLQNEKSKVISEVNISKVDVHEVNEDVYEENLHEVNEHVRENNLLKLSDSKISHVEVRKPNKYSQANTPTESFNNTDNDSNLKIEPVIKTQFLDKHSTIPVESSRNQVADLSIPLARDPDIAYNKCVKLTNGHKDLKIVNHNNKNSDISPPKNKINSSLNSYRPTADELVRQLTVLKQAAINAKPKVSEPKDDVSTETLSNKAQIQDNIPTKPEMDQVIDPRLGTVTGKNLILPEEKFPSVTKNTDYQVTINATKNGNIHTSADSIPQVRRPYLPPKFVLTSWHENVSPVVTRIADETTHGSSIYRLTNGNKSTVDVATRDFRSSDQISYPSLESDNTLNSSKIGLDDGEEQPQSPSKIQKLTIPLCTSHISNKANKFLLVGSNPHTMGKWYLSQTDILNETDPPLEGEGGELV